MNSDVQKVKFSTKSKRRNKRQRINKPGMMNQKDLPVSSIPPVFKDSSSSSSTMNANKPTRRAKRGINKLQKRQIPILTPDEIFSQAAERGNDTFTSGSSRLKPITKVTGVNKTKMTKNTNKISPEENFVFFIPLKQCCFWAQILINFSESWDNLTVYAGNLINTLEDPEVLSSSEDIQTDDVIFRDFFSSRKIILEIVNLIKNRIIHGLSRVFNDKLPLNYSDSKSNYIQERQWAQEILIQSEKVTTAQQNIQAKIKISKTQIIQLWMKFLTVTLKDSATDTETSSENTESSFYTSSDTNNSKNDDDIQTRWRNLFPKLLASVNIGDSRRENSMSLESLKKRIESDLETENLNPSEHQEININDIERNQIYNDWNFEDFHTFGMIVPGFVQKTSLANSIYKFTKHCENQHNILLEYWNRKTLQLQFDLAKTHQNLKTKIIQYYYFNLASLDAKRRKYRQTIAEKECEIENITKETTDIQEKLIKATESYWNFRIHERQTKSILMDWVAKSKAQEDDVKSRVSKDTMNAVQLESMVDQTIGPIVDWVGHPIWKILKGKEIPTHSQQMKLEIESSLPKSPSQVNQEPNLELGLITSEELESGINNENSIKDFFDEPMESTQNIYNQLQSASRINVQLQKIQEQDAIEYGAVLVLQRTTRRYFERKRKLQWIEENKPPVVEVVEPVKTVKKKKSKKKRKKRK